MAYIKKEEFNNGFSAEYWRVVDIKVSKLKNTVEVLVRGYKDKKARLDGSKPVGTKVFLLKTEAIDLSKDLFAEAYTAIKNAPAFMKKEKFFEDAVIDD